VCLFVVPFFATAQSTQDTINFPYWLDMMQDPSINFYQTQRAFNLYWSNKTIEKGCGYKPFKRWEYAMQEIIDAKGNIPAPGELERRVERYKRYGIIYNGGPGNSYVIGGVNTADCLKNGDWEELGPTQIPGNRTSQPNGLGRINGLAFHPTDSNIIYAGAPAGGLWITEDGGANWYTTTDTLASLGVSAIAVDPLYPDTIYIGTGDRDASDSYGRGIFKSTDGGVSWKPASSGMGNTIVGRLIIDPNNHQTLLAATNSGIFRSTNGGDSWTRTIAGNFKDIDLCYDNPNYVYAATYGNCKFYRSTDNGQSFTHISSILPTGQRRMVIGTTKADSNMVYVLITESRKFKGLYLSTDKGLTFTTMSTTPNIMDYSANGSGTGGQAWYDLDIVIDMDNPADVYVGGINIFKSTDSGRTWQINAHWVGSAGAPSIHADQHALEIQPSTGAVYVGNDGGVYYSKDGGDSWIDISDDLSIAQIYRLSQNAKNPTNIINGFQDNGTGMYENREWYTVMGGDGMDCAIDPENPSFAYSNLYYGDVRRYTDGWYSGKIAANGTNGINESGAWVTPFVLREGLPSTMYIGYKNIWRSTNIQASSASAVSWTKISNNLDGNNSQTIRAVENSPANSDILYIAKSNALLRSDNINDVSPTYTNLKSNLPNAAPVQWIETDHKRESTVWIAQSNKVYESTDKGASWNNISAGLPNIPVLSLVFDSSSARRGLYAGTYMGVFYKDTTMSQWQWFNEHMPIHTRVRDMDIYYSPTGRGRSHIVCATYGRGNWKSPLYDEDENTPTAGFYATKTTLCLGNELSLIDTSDNIPTAWQWVITPSTFRYINGTDSCSKNPQLQFTSKGSYTIKQVVANCAGKDSITKSAYIEVFDAIDTVACTGNTTNQNFSILGLFSVQIDSFYHSSPGTRAEGGYVDRGCTEVFTLKNDTTYSAELNTGTSYTQYARIYIDFNKNGSLADPGEAVWVSKAKGLHLDSIKIPLNVVYNEVLRMRIMVDYDSIPDNPCDTLSYGQTEDFGVIFKPRKPEPNFVVDTNLVCSGVPIQLTDSSEGPITNYQWHIEGQTGFILDTTGAGPFQLTLLDTGYYSVTLYLNDSLVSRTKDSIWYVKPSPMSNLLVANGSPLGCEGRDLDLKVTSNYPTLVAYSWYLNNTLQSATDSVLNISAITSSSKGHYQAIVSINDCADTTNALYVAAYPLPVTSFGLNDTAQCLRGNGFEISETTSLASGNFSTTSYFGDGDSSLLADPLYTYTSAGNYTIQLVSTSDSGCIDSSSVNVVIYDNPSADFTINKNYQCLNENTFTLESTSLPTNSTHNWSLSDGSAFTSDSLTHVFSTFGTFNAELVIEDGNACTDTIVKQLVVLESPEASFNIDEQSNCLETNLLDFENNTQFTSGAIGNVVWDLGDGSSSNSNDVYGKSYTSTGTFDIELQVSGNNGCSDTLSKQVSIYHNPIINLSLNSDEQCLEGNKLLITNSSSTWSGNISQHNWILGDGTSLSTPDVDYSYSTESLYLVNYTVESSVGCSHDTTFSVTIHPSPSVGFTGGTVCLGEPLNFLNNSTISAGSIANYVWNLGDGNSSNESNPMHIYADAGNYNVSLLAISNEGCRDSLTLNAAAEILPTPTAEFSFERIASWEMETTLKFTDLSTDAVLYNWSFGNGTTSSEVNPTITYTDTGSKQVYLVVEAANGCVDTLARVIQVFPESTMYIPTSFTPNGDNLNDVFRPLGIAVAKSYSLKIYNRWGALVFESTDPTKGWDGKSQGEYQASGNYLYVLNMVDFNGSRVTEKGVLSLLR
jgi:gliding motility-associated-like protein